MLSFSAGHGPGPRRLGSSHVKGYIGNQETWCAIMDRYVNWHGERHIHRLVLQWHNHNLKAT